MSLLAMYVLVWHRIALISVLLGATTKVTERSHADGTIHVCAAAIEEVGRLARRTAHSSTFGERVENALARSIERAETVLAAAPWQRVLLAHVVIACRASNARTELVGSRYEGRQTLMVWQHAQAAALREASLDLGPGLELGIKVTGQLASRKVNDARAVTHGTTHGVATEHARQVRVLDQTRARCAKIRADIVTEAGGAQAMAARMKDDLHWVWFVGVDRANGI